MIMYISNPQRFQRAKRPKKKKREKTRLPATDLDTGTGASVACQGQRSPWQQIIQNNYLPICALSQLEVGCEPGRGSNADQSIGGGGLVANITPPPPPAPLIRIKFSLLIAICRTSPQPRRADSLKRSDATSHITPLHRLPTPPSKCHRAQLSIASFLQ